MNVLESDKREWKAFTISDVFEVYTGATIQQSKLLPGKVPRVTVTDTNNGITLFTDYLNCKNFRIYSNIISISFLGSVFYHQNHVSLDMKVHGLKLKNKIMNEHIALFLIPIIKKMSSKYSYGNQLSGKILRRQKILLPIDKEGFIDFEHMEQYARKIKLKGLKKLQNHYKNKQLKVKVNNNFMVTDNIKYSEFRILDIFDTVQRGKRLTKANQIEGNTPYVSSTGNNNGVDNFIGNVDKVRKFSKSITIANSGSVGSSFYHTYEFIASDHVTNLYSKKANKYSYLYIVTALLKLNEKYSFNREISDKRMSREKILLPIDNEGAINWDYMEFYMRNVEGLKIRKVLDYIEMKLLTVM